MRQFLSVILLNFAMLSPAAEFTSIDINTALTGSTESLGAGAYVVTAGGADIWGTSDGFRFVYQTFSGDFDIRARVSEISPTNVWAKAGVMVRSASDNSSMHAMMVATSGNGYAFQYRQNAGDNSFHIGGGVTNFPFSWIRLIRIGTTVAGYKSTDPQGDEWQFVGSVEMLLTDTVLVGLCATAHDNTKLCTAIFDSVHLGASVPPTIGHGTGLNAKYFNNYMLSGIPIIERLDSDINFNWGTTAPDALISADNFSVHWSGMIEPQYSEEYTFFTTSDDGVRLWINGQLIVDNWTDHGPTENRSLPISLVAGLKYPVVYEFYERGGGAAAELAWSSRSTFKQAVPSSQMYPDSISAVVADGTGLRGEYFSTSDLSQSAFVRMDPYVDFEWGSGSPALIIPADHFSVRWTGQVQPRYSGLYTFYTQSDDGIRLWINNELIINNWTDHASTENTGVVALTAGNNYDIRLEYYENAGGAISKLYWSSCEQAKEIVPSIQLYPGNGQGFFAEYFDNLDFSSPKLHRIDSKIDFDWMTGSPDAKITPDTFSVRWSGMLEPKYSENYTFHTVSDNGVRLWVNGQLVIDNWPSHTVTENSSAPLYLTAGIPIEIKLEYFENEGSAIVKLLWSSASQVKQIVPTSQVRPEGGMLVSIPSASSVSPACVEGKMWSLNGQAVEIDYKGNGQSSPVTYLGPTRFYVDIPLSPAAGTSVEFRHSGSGIIDSGMITWIPTNISGKTLSLDQLYLRRGDALLLTATGGGSALTIDADGNSTIDYAGLPGQSFSHEFNTVGQFIVTAKIDGINVGSVLVTVVSVDLQKPIAGEVGFERRKNVVVNPSTAWSGVAFTAADNGLLGVESGGPFDNDDGKGAIVYLRPTSRGTPVLIARAGNSSGAILAFKEIEEFTLDREGMHAAVVNEETRIGGTFLTIRPYIPNIRFQFNMFAHTSTFAGGVSNLSVNTSDVDPLTQVPLFELIYDTNAQEYVGRFRIELEVPQNETMFCFSTQAFQSSSAEQVIAGKENTNGCVCLGTVSQVVLCLPERDFGTMNVSTKLTGPSDEECLGPFAIYVLPDNNGVRIIEDTVPISCGDSASYTVQGLIPGIYSVAIGGAVFKDTICVIKITAEPNDKIICIGESITFSATGDPAGGTFTWRSDDGNPDNGSGPKFTTKFDSVGEKEVFVSYCFANCCCSETLKVCVVKVGSVTPSETIVCVEEPITFTATPDGCKDFPAGHPKWKLIQGDGTPTEGTGTTFTVTPKKGYVGIIEVEAKCGGADPGKTATSEVVGVASIEPSKDPVLCVGDTIVLTAKSTGSGFPAGHPDWEVIGGPGTVTPTQGNPVELTSTGFGIVTVRARCGEQDEGVLIEIQVVDVGEITANKPIICVGDSVTFTATAVGGFGAFPQGEPKWKLLTPDIAQAVGPSTGSTFTVKSTKPGLIKVSAKCHDGAEKQGSVPAVRLALKEIKNLRKSTVGDFSQETDPRASGRLFIDTTEEWNGGELQSAQYDKQRAKVIAMIEGPPGIGGLRVKWELRDLDDPASHSDIDKNDNGTPVGGTARGADNTGKPHEAATHWFTRADDAITEQDNAEASDENDVIGSAKTDTTAGAGGYTSTVFFNYSDDGGDNFSIKAILVFDQELDCFDESGVLTLWRKRFMRVWAMANRAAVNWYPSNAGNLAGVRAFMQSGFSAPDANENAYIDFSVTEEKTNLVERPVLVAHVVGPASLAQYLQDTIHAADDTHEDNTYDLVGVRDLRLAGAGVLPGTNRHSPHTVTAVSTTSAWTGANSTDGVSLHEVAHGVLADRTNLHEGHSAAGGGAFNRCAGAVLPPAADKPLHFCPKHLFLMRGNCTRSWGVHNEAAPLQRETARDSD